MNEPLMGNAHFCSDICIPELLLSFCMICCAAYLPAHSEFFLPGP